MKYLKSAIWNDYLGKKLLLVALVLSLITHGVILYFTLPKTYDAFVHLFFADHYSRFWFEPWEYRWYTGFLTTSYPPLVHQVMALISKVFPLKVAFCIYANSILLVLIVGVYRFTKLFFNKTTAGVASILTVILSSIIETLHVYGQMPTLTGLAFLLNALPFLYQYFVKKKTIYLIMALVFLSVVISAHHVTAIFGMVFFVAPTIWMALCDTLPNNNQNKNFISYVFQIVKEAFKKYKQFILFGVLLLVLIVGLIYPYWYWSKNDPITQVSIPHGSRDNFFAKPSSGLIFFIIPLLLIFALLPAITYSITRQKRFIGWAVAFFLCLLFGSGGTTPLPKILLGSNAFNILTLDRFGFWASIIAIPFMAKFILSFIAGPVYNFWVQNFGKSSHFILVSSSGFVYLLFIIFVFHLGSFRPLQPKEIEIQPILNFLNRDDHLRWRFLTLGFGDQMAWLSANSLAASVDGNYHSARRLPELTSRPIERLENAKFNGNEGLASLNDFLGNAEKYNLKYIFSNDRYYDPLLYFTGWNRTIQLENGIMVWEKGNISTIKPITPKQLSPLLKKAWSIIPVSALVAAILLTLWYLKKHKEQDYFIIQPETDNHYPKLILLTSATMPLVLSLIFVLNQVYELVLVKEQKSPETTILNYYNHLDFQRFEKAFHFFQTSPTYSLNQYLLEKSVNEGGLLPSYAKLDSLATKNIKQQNDSATVEVFTRWKTSLGTKTKVDTMYLVKQQNKWSIIPKLFEIEIPEEQVRSYNYVLYKKQGKRVISSFATVKDDKITKPFATYKQVNCIQNGNEIYVVGDILNADNVPINIAPKILVKFINDSTATFYPNTVLHYNLAPKENTFFKISITDNANKMLPIKSIQLYTETDVSERGYIHGGIINYSTSPNNNTIQITTKMYNPFTTDINIPGMLVAQKDVDGNIWQTNLIINENAIRSGLQRTFNSSIEKLNSKVILQKQIPIELYINGQLRNSLPLEKDPLANANNGVVILPHCFMAQEIYLH